jgi:phospholipase D1/2
MGFDTECDIAIHGPPDLIAGFREKLLSEQLGTSSKDFAATLRHEGSIIATIALLNVPHSRSLRPIVTLPENWIGKILADTRLMDPRYDALEHSNAGVGLRPRHIAIAAAGVVAVYLARKLWRHWREN